ncbi:aliphatic sulfonate ABC transporter substrate-binding protein [Deinococcus hopiensis]|uniref:Putative aliphatic sulfonates-binding protein n=1 Tax=Deinococcus hopiensis KR-140 TaxID=695939 RepID=A0A1W1VVT3_9DEIO|nr:aliphatic sulfonate ABC transporter substrate-binding protein [Deinococcus hopiensis]SMB97448.1 sulfonate transport system substrate-binding protein [Deinococcus hopiensis KR-140]
MSTLSRALLLGAALTLTHQAQAATIFNIGYQKGGLLALLKARGTLDPAKAQGIEFKWSLFTAGPPLLEAANAGAIDFGSVGDTPGVFALAGGADLKYVAVTEAQSDTASAIIVPTNSPIKTVADLKGKRIGLARGSSAHFFAYRALKAAKLTFNDVTIVSLLPPDARPAFESGTIDAWVIWEPFLTTALQATKARVIRDLKGLGRSNSYFLVRSKVTQDAEKRRALQYLLRALDQTADWANKNQAAVITQISEELGLPRSVAAVSVPKSMPFNIRPFRPSDSVPLQRLADTFYEIKILPTPLKIDATRYVPLNFTADR